MFQALEWSPKIVKQLWSTHSYLTAGSTTDLISSSGPAKNEIVSVAEVQQVRRGFGFANQQVGALSADSAVG